MRTRNRVLSAAVVTAAALAISSAGTTSAAGNPSFPEGVYRAKITRADILRVWPNANGLAFRALPGTWTRTFRNGSWNEVHSGGGVPHCRRADGRYSVQGRFLILTVLDVHGCPGPGTCPCVRKLQWSYEDETLRLRLVSPAFPFVHALWEAVPLVRIR